MVEPEQTSIARKQLGKYCLNPGIVGLNAGLPIYLANGSRTFPRQQIHEEQWRRWPLFGPRGSGGGVEYLHRRPASRRRRRKGKSRISDSKIVATSPTGLGPENDCSGEGQQQIETTDPPSRQRPTLTNLQISNSNKNLVVSLRWVLYSKTDWSTNRGS
jgi:hypothetical protein